MFLDPRLLDLLSGTIASVWGVEVLLLMRQQPQRYWKRDDLVSELRSSGLVVDQSLHQLERGGLVVSDEQGAARFSPATADLSYLVDQLDVEYRSRPAVVRRAIVSGSGNKLQSFSDAFLIRKPLE